MAAVVVVFTGGHRRGVQVQVCLRAIVGRRVDGLVVSLLTSCLSTDVEVGLRAAEVRLGVGRGQGRGGGRGVGGRGGGVGGGGVRLDGLALLGVVTVITVAEGGGGKRGRDVAGRLAHLHSTSLVTWWRQIATSQTSCSKLWLDLVWAGIIRAGNPPHLPTCNQLISIQQGQDKNNMYLSKQQID